MRWRINRFHEAAQAVYQFFWGDFLRLVYRMGEAGFCRMRIAGGRMWRGRICSRDLMRRLRPAASVHAVFDGRVVANQLPQRAGAKSIALDAYPGGAGGVEGCGGAGGVWVDSGSDSGFADGAIGD